MRYSMIALLLGLLAAPSLGAQGVPGPVLLDSGTVVRLHWPGGHEKGRLLAAFGREAVAVRYCRYPSPVCGESTLNPPRTRAAQDLTRVEVRRGSRTRRGALIGAAVGALGGLVYLLGSGFGDGPALSTREQVLSVALLAGTWSGIGAFVGSMSDDWKAVP